MRWTLLTKAALFDAAALDAAILDAFLAVASAAVREACALLRAHAGLAAVDHEITAVPVDVECQPIIEARS